MKKALFLLVCVCAIVFSGCKDESYESGVYAGTYSGTFNIVKKSDNSISTKNGKLHFGQNPANKENMLWEYVIDMKKTGSGVFETSDDSFSAEMIKAATSLINIDEYTDQTIDKINAKATFDGSDVTMKIYYQALVMGVEMEIVIATFTGTKEK